MNAASIVWSAISGFLKAANAILSVVPGLVWALALSAALVHGWWVTGERDDAVTAKSEAIGALQVVRGMIKAQKEAAAKLLADLTAQVQVAQSRLNEDRRQQEIKDANAKVTIDAQAARLRALAAAAPGGQLRDPNAAGCGRGGPAAEGRSVAAAGGGAPDGAQAGGLLSAQLSGLLVRLTGEADDINRAYAACRDDALSVRRALQSPPPSAVPAAPAAP